VSGFCEGISNCEGIALGEDQERPRNDITLLFSRALNYIGDLDMKSDELRAIQAPLKEKYKEAPAAALITLKAKGRIGEGITCKIETGRAMVEAGLHEATGGTGLTVCSGDMLLEALVACAGVTLNAVATAIGVTLRDGTVRAEGDIDFRGTLGVSKDAPAGFQNIRLFFDLDSDASDEQLASLKKLTERYCVVFQTLQQSPLIETSYSIV
jgi:uncharacterized OsmC-like protein